MYVILNFWSNYIIGLLELVGWMCCCSGIVVVFLDIILSNGQTSHIRNSSLCPAWWSDSHEKKMVRSNSDRIRTGRPIFLEFLWRLVGCFFLIFFAARASALWIRLSSSSSATNSLVSYSETVAQPWSLVAANLISICLPAIVSLAFFKWVPALVGSSIASLTRSSMDWLNSNWRLFPSLFHFFSDNEESFLWTAWIVLWFSSLNSAFVTFNEWAKECDSPWTLLRLLRCLFSWQSSC